jgi:hypothetical protein
MINSDGNESKNFNQGFKKNYPLISLAEKKLEILN